MHKLVERVITVTLEELLEIDVSPFVDAHVDSHGGAIVDWCNVQRVVTAFVLAKVTNNFPPATSVDTQLTWNDQGCHIHMAWVEWQDEEQVEGD